MLYKKIIIAVGKYIGLILIVAILTWQAHEFKNTFTSNGSISDIDNISETKQKLEKLNISGKYIASIAEAIDNAYKLTGISPNMLIAIIQSESAFRITAVSDRGYKGLMQTPWALMRPNRAAIHIDVLHGAEIFKGKLLIARARLIKKGVPESGILLEALSLYKGGAYETARNIATRNTQARREAEKTYQYYIALPGSA